MAEPAQRVRRGRGRRPAGEVRAGVLAAAGDLLLTQEGAGPVIAGLIGAAQTDPDLSAAFTRQYAGPRRELAVRALEKARDREELRGDRDLGILVDQLWGACYHRLLIPDGPLDEEFALALVENALDGAAVPR